MKSNKVLIKKNNTIKYDICICVWMTLAKIYEEWEGKRLIRKTRSRKRERKLIMGEKLLIVVLYPFRGFKNFKYYYQYVVEIKYKDLFKSLPFYNRYYTDND